MNRAFERSVNRTQSTGESQQSGSETQPPHNPSPRRAERVAAALPIADRIGSGWDAAPGPDAVLTHHMDEWVSGSGVASELAAANLQSLQGWPVLEALAGDRLEALSAHASQYVTNPVGRLLRPLEHLAEAGGWWCSGLDPLADWGPMSWGCFKPDAPRWDAAKGRPRKYEHPSGSPARLFWLRVPAVIAQRVADRHGLVLPDAVVADGDGSAGAFWRWWAQTPALPLLVTEGAKKAAALLSVGVPSVAAPGIWNPAPKGSNGRPALHPELAAVPLQGRPAWVLFDYSDRPAPDEPRAARRLGRLLERAGAAVKVGIVPGSHGKGADDHLANGGTWEQLAAVLQPIAQQPVMPRRRKAVIQAAAGQHLAGVAEAHATTLQNRRLIATDAPMGSGKTIFAAQVVAPFLADGVPVVAPTHRVSLGEAQAEAVGIAWAPPPGSIERLLGGGLCWESLRPSSGLQFDPDAFRSPDGLGPVVLLDEIAQGIEHVLFGHGTAVAAHRPEVMATAGRLLQSARLLLAMDAQLSEPVLQLLETLSGDSALMIGSDHQPMATRPVMVPQGLTARTAAEQGRARVLELARSRRRTLVITTAQQSHAKGAAANLAGLVRRHWPEARVLVVDSEHQDAAEQLGRDPNGTAAAHDFLVCSPSITSGLSIDQTGLFDEVVVIGAGGRLPAEQLVQAAARVRDPACPVRIYAPAIAPQLRVGSGDTDPAALLKHLARCEAQLLADLVAEGGWDAATPTASPWLRCYLELAAHRNRQSHAYSCTIAGLLTAEGWAVEAPVGLPASSETAQASADLAEITAVAVADADAAVIAAAAITDREAAELGRKRRRTAEEHAQLRRHRIARRWGLGDSPPSAELLDADRRGLARPLRFRWLLQQADRAQLIAAHDRRRARELAPDGKGWAPDLVRELLAHKVAAADAIALSSWLGRTGQWIQASDPQLLHLQTLAIAHSGDLRVALGIGPGKRASGTLRAVAALLGCQLEAERYRCGEGRRSWRYRLAPISLPNGVTSQQLEISWREQLCGS